MKMLMMLFVTFSITSCNTLKPIEICTLQFSSTRILDDCRCICKVRDMLKGKTIGDIYEKPVDYCDKQLSFHAENSWPQLDAFLQTVGKKIKESDDSE